LEPVNVVSAHSGQVLHSMARAEHKAVPILPQVR
jgi:hypothetical protein